MKGDHCHHAVTRASRRSDHVFYFIKDYWLSDPAASRAVHINGNVSRLEMGKNPGEAEAAKAGSYASSHRYCNAGAVDC